MSEVNPERAAVKPRILVEGIGSVPLESEVERLCAKAPAGAIALSGASGSGKTTALRHLAATLEINKWRLILLDTPKADEVLDQARSHLVLYSAINPIRVGHLGELKLAPWTMDDVIEYVMARHRDRCAELVTRAQALPDAGELEGSPRLWTAVLDELVRDPALASCEAALNGYLAASVKDLKQAQLACFVALSCFGEALKLPTRFGGKDVIERFLEEVVFEDFESNRVGYNPFLVHPFVRTILASRAVVDLVLSGKEKRFLACQIPEAIVRHTGHLLKASTWGLSFLEFRLLENFNLYHAMAASLLHAAGALKKLPPKAYLRGAYLSGIKLSGCCWLDEMKFPFADLTGADLSGANLEKAVFNQANLANANLSQANLKLARLDRANLSNATLLGAKADCCRAPGACFCQANLFEISGIRMKLTEADLRHAIFSKANMKEADLTSANIDGADFSNANFHGARMADLPLKLTRLFQTNFESAKLMRTDFEGVDLKEISFKGADLTGAILTGSRMRSVTFRGACLKHAKLAEIDWEGADLREADLTKVNFHLGNTRAGLVFGQALEGSMTGFYTDEYAEQHFKRPEQIRKANLRGADLRGAKIHKTDFYLVDLREAKLDPQQLEHLRNCRAILKDPG